MEAEELPLIAIEISVLSALERSGEVSAIEVGKHGLVVTRGGFSGLLLPQVAAEYGWDRETFLSQTCLKAGLPSGAWREGTEIFTFTAEVFGERDPGSA